MDLSNWINLAILFITALVGILTWFGARKSANEARADQREANASAIRSAAAAEEAGRLQSRLVEIENQRHQEAALDSRRAKLRAELTEKNVYRFNKPDKDRYLTIFNAGESTALNLDVIVNNNSIGELQEFVTRLPETVSVGANGRLDLHFVLFRGGPLRLPFQVELKWSDDSGLPGEWSGMVS